MPSAPSATASSRPSSSGVSLPIYKTLAFGVSAAFAGVAGSLLVLVTNGYAQPGEFGVLLSLQILIGAAVAGLGSLWGVLVGAVFVGLLPSVAPRRPADRLGARPGRRLRPDRRPDHASAPERLRRLPPGALNRESKPLSNRIPGVIIGTPGFRREGSTMRRRVGWVTKSRILAVLAGAAIVGGIAVTAAFGAHRATPGVSATTITIGGTFPLTGPASLYKTIPAAETCVLRLRQRPRRRQRPQDRLQGPRRRLRPVEDGAARRSSSSSRTRCSRSSAASAPRRTSASGAT